MEGIKEENEKINELFDAAGALMSAMGQDPTKIEAKHEQTDDGKNDIILNVNGEEGGSIIIQEKIYLALGFKYEELQTSAVNIGRLLMAIGMMLGATKIEFNKENEVKREL